MRLVFALSLAVLGCNKQPAAPSCDDRVKAFDEALASPAAGTCSADSDCKCFRGGVSEKHACGGLTDTKTNDKLAGIAADYDGSGCKSGIDCAAWVCTPSCQGGKCTNGPPPVLAPPPSAAPKAAPTATPTTSTSASPEAGTTCATRLAEIDRVLASGTRKCKTNADCVCFRGGVSKSDPCGGITDSATNARFEALAKEWKAAGCDKHEAVMCPAMVCAAACRAGKCEPPGVQDVIQ